MPHAAIQDLTRTTFTPCADNTQKLRDAFGRFATGVTIVTANAGSGTVAITASSFSSVSLNPPLVLWSPEKNSRRFRYFVEARHYAIHVLSAEQEQLAHDVGHDMWALQNHDLQPNPYGVPVIEGALARFDCARTRVYEGGDHAIILGQVNHTEMSAGGDALGFFRGKMLRLAQ